MLKIPLHLCIITLLLISTEICINPVRSNISFVNSFWNTLNYGENDPLTDWSESGNLDFSILDYTGSFYIKNDFNNLLLGILILGKITINWTCIINFDVDADRGWAEDAKELNLRKTGENTIFSYKDQYYVQNNPQPFDDPQVSDFTASYRTFLAAGNNYIIFEVTIPFQTSDLLRDLQIYNPENSIIGISLDFFNIDSSQNDTWCGAAYPNYANAGNYLQILFAGPQDRKIPIFEEETPPTNDTTTEEENNDTGLYDYESASPSFEFSIGLLALCLSVFILRKVYRKGKK